MEFLWIFNSLKETQSITDDSACKVKTIRNKRCQRWDFIPLRCSLWWWSLDETLGPQKSGNPQETRPQDRIHPCPGSLGCLLRKIFVQIASFIMNDASSPLKSFFGVAFCFVFSLGEMRDQQGRAGGNKGFKVSLVACPLSGHVLGRELKRPEGKFRAEPSLLSALEGNGSTQLFCIAPAQATHVIGLEAPWKYLCTWWSLPGA